LLGLFCSLGVNAAASVASLNQCPDMIFIDGFKDESIPSDGMGGSFPGSFQTTINVNNTYYYYIPSSYQTDQAMPLLVVWHGAAGAGNAVSAAIATRDYWVAEAESNHFIVVAQVATGASGGWEPIPDANRMADIIDDMQARYNIETSRRYVWGFSAGGHVMHAIALQNSNYFAAYAVSAGVLAAYAGNSAPANAMRQLPVYVSVGNTDTLLSYAQNDKLLFLQAGWQEGQNYWMDVFSGGHVLPNDLPEKAWHKICISTNIE